MDWEELKMVEDHEPEDFAKKTIEYMIKNGEFDLPYFPSNVRHSDYYKKSIENERKPN